MSKSLLVTGGAGFIGANFIHYWLNRYPDDTVICLDALTYAGNIANLKSITDCARYTFVKGDIGNEALVKRLMLQHKVDTIVHFAAESHVDRSITEPDAFLKTNVLGTHALLKVAKECWLDSGSGIPHRFHHISTDEVYGTLERDDSAFTESTAYAPNSPYSASKAASDFLVRAYHHTYGLEVSTSNCSNNYGPYHFPEKLIPLVITNILLERKLPIYGDGKQIRDWIYVDDHIRGIDMVITKGKVGEAYNIGCNNEWQNIDIVLLICAAVDRSFASSSGLQIRFPDARSAACSASADLIEYVTDRPGHDRRYAVNASKIQSELGYVPEVSFETGIEKTLAWFLANEAWWRPLVRI